MVFENLHFKDKVKPGSYKKIIEDLVSSGDITEKTVKKAKILFANQANKPEVDKAGLQKMDDEISQLRDEYEGLQTRLRELEQERTQLKQQLTNEELEAELKKYTKEVLATTLVVSS
jgi:chromosome segregation ATPase